MITLRSCFESLQRDKTGVPGLSSWGASRADSKDNDTGLEPSAERSREQIRHPEVVTELVEVLSKDNTTNGELN